MEWGSRRTAYSSEIASFQAIFESVKLGYRDIVGFFFCLLYFPYISIYIDVKPLWLRFFLPTAVIQLFPLRSHGGGDSSLDVSARYAFDGDETLPKAQ